MCSYSVIVHLSRVHCLRGDDFSCDHHFKHEAAGSSPALSAKFLGFDREPVNWVFIRAVLASVAEIAIVPLQDVLGLGSEARMNLPGTMTGNCWKWRCRPDSLTKDVTQRLRDLAVLYDR